MPAVSRILPWLLLSALVDRNCYSLLPTSQQSTQITTAMPRWNACRKHAVPYRSNILPSRQRQCTQPKQGLRHEPHAPRPPSRYFADGHGAVCMPPGCLGNWRNSELGSSTSTLFFWLLNVAL